jgi:hypothetical protein
MQNQGGGRQHNARNSGSVGSSDMRQEETVRYINKSENPDHKVH